jgi:hypothetical protein
MPEVFAIMIIVVGLPAVAFTFWEIGYDQGLQKADLKEWAHHERRLRRVK